MRFSSLALFSLLLFNFQKSFSQELYAAHWADSVFNSLTDDERIAQLLVVRSSGMDANGDPVIYESRVDSLVTKYNIGAICAFQGSPIDQAKMFNRMQALAKTPVMITVDAEWGLGMRFEGVKSFPYQLTMGALTDASLVYKVGSAIGEQLGRMRIHVNYAPVVDINNNPDNPVIGIRSFGEDKYKVALMGTQIMEGIQSKGVMACAKHFPGHGDVAVDSHYDLPVINKTMAQLDTLELYPFKQLFAKGVGSVMIAHLYIPAIDTTPNQATSLSYKNVTELMRQQLGYTGLTFTDALEMKGVSKYYPGGEASVQSLIAGNDMLCLPESVPATIEAVKQAVTDNRLTWDQVYSKCKRVLLAKYLYVNGKTDSVETDNLLRDLNADVDPLRKEVAEKAITVISLKDDMLPLRSLVRKSNSGKAGGKVLYIAAGSNGKDELAERLKASLGATVIAAPFNSTAALNKLTPEYLSRFDKIVIGLHGIGRYPARNFGVPMSIIDKINQVQAQNDNALLLTFGNPYINKFFQNSPNLVACYEDDNVFNSVAADWLLGKFEASGTLPVTVGNFKYGTGLVKKNFEIATPESVDMQGQVLSGIDQVAEEAIAKKATPGCVVTVVRHGKMVFQKAYGYLTYTDSIPVTTNTIFDLASVTKIAATTVSVMKLVEEGKIALDQPIGKYLPWLKNSDKNGLLVENLMLHQAGLNAWIPFYKDVIDGNGKPFSSLFATSLLAPFTTTVTNDLYLRSDYVDSMLDRIKQSDLRTADMKYVYSDNDFILMGKIVEAVTGETLDNYARENFYEPMGMLSTTFKPFNHFANDMIAPTEAESQFRNELIWGYVHDPGAAMFGNVAGHAGLFSNATDLARLFQMLLNGGVYNKKRYLKKETIDFFTAYQTPISRRGLGFDKPEKDNAIKPADKTYPAQFVSPATFGHTGFTGICVWADPKYDLLYIFMSNRVNPVSDNPRLVQLNIRSRIQDIIYQSLEPEPVLN